MAHCGCRDCTSLAAAHRDLSVMRAFQIWPPNGMQWLAINGDYYVNDPDKKTFEYRMGGCNMRATQERPDDY